MQANRRNAVDVCEPRIDERDETFRLKRAKGRSSGVAEWSGGFPPCHQLRTLYDSDSEFLRGDLDFQIRFLT
jgi:hypothetical protein